ncbi:hypothetical protein MTBPR1_20153 [Candidatus Terasakiella magnetica]|uniref:Transglutaminase-like domain-containing protein n=1 Tax=Candidatus Terasakiella magnetica TaxID=1867952 RepID=A0A1C3RGB6_9PROT|nr:hypothetical protein [Candidatus Terasakiella magnetica]SCA56305.1 hypothetical protein MTBPR1_20153 [Candidatus Terasakiella magnetica]
MRPHVRFAAPQGETHKNGLVRLSYSDMEERLEGLSKQNTEQYLRDVVEIFAARLVHYWPEDGQFDQDIVSNVRENWVLTFLSYSEKTLVEAGILDKYRFSRIERQNWQDITKKGVGLCSQVSLAAADFLVEQGFKVNMIGLDGHVVAMVSEGAEQYLLDVDMNVLLPFGLDYAENNPDGVIEAYTLVGHSKEYSKKIATIYSPEGNFLSSADSYYPTVSILFTFLNISVWFFPLSILIFGFIVLYYRK